MIVNPMTSSLSGVSFVVHKLGTEVGPLKQVRELVVNGFEAVQAYRALHPGEQDYRGRVDVLVDAFYRETEGVRKIAFADNGVGMDAHEIRKYFNSLSETGKKQAVDQNFGVGAKISTAAWNPFGVEIRSWKDGVGHLVRLVYDDRTDRYGLLCFEVGDQRPDYLATDSLENAELLKPRWIGDHGTAVVLLGRTKSEDTCLAPESTEVTHREYWLPHVLNRQFFKVPAGVELRTSVEVNADRPNVRRIEGYEPVLDEFSPQRGTVQLDDAYVHWWILDEARKDELTSKRPYYHAFSGYKNHGHVAAIFRDELFDFTSHSLAIPMLQRFGIVAGYNRVVIYVEPMPHVRVSANLTRTSLVMPDGTGLPWHKWANEFYQRMPDELAAYVERQQHDANVSENDFVKREIRKYQDLLRIKYRRPAPRGADAAGATGNDAPKTTSGPRTASAGETAPAKPREAQFVPRLRSGAGDVHVEESPLAIEPKWNWVSADEAMLHDRAARFTHERLFLEINRDFVVLRELVDYGLSFVRPDARVRHAEHVEQLVRQHYLLQLIWVTMSAMASFRHRGGWTGDGFDKLVGEEALTATVLSRMHLMEKIRDWVRSNPTMRRDLVEQPGEDAA